MNVSNLKFTGERCIPNKMSGHIKIYQHHLARYNFALMYTRKKRVLDAACGSGFGCELMADVARSVVGVDKSKDAIEYARYEYPKSYYRVVDLDAEELPEEPFDIITSFETIEHLENPEHFLSMIKDAAPEFLFSIPVDAEGDFHKQLFSKEQIVQFMENYFKDITWFSQSGLNIAPGIKRPKYLIGYVSKKI